MTSSIALTIWTAWMAIVIAAIVWLYRRGPGLVRRLIRDAVLDALEEERLRAERRAK